jgi:O-antigen/teichoic acid export membrane protein
MLSSSAVYLFSSILNAAIPFALLPILTRHLSPTEYGEVAMLTTLVGALGAFVGLNVVGAAGRKYFDGDNGRDELRWFIGACAVEARRLVRVSGVQTQIPERSIGLWSAFDAPYHSQLFAHLVRSFHNQCRYGYERKLVFNAINKAYAPWLFERLKSNQTTQKRKIIRYTYVWFAFIVFGVVPAFLIGPGLVGLKYAQAGEIFGWLALGQGFGGMYLW